MSTRKATTYVQYSKRVAGAITAFWCLYRILVLVLVYLRPDLAESMKTIQTGVDDVMMVSVGFYTGNSVVEKGIVGYFGRKNDSEEADESNG